LPKWQKTILYLICPSGPCGTLKNEIKIKEMVHNNNINKNQLAALASAVNESAEVAAVR